MSSLNMRNDINVRVKRDNWKLRSGAQALLAKNRRAFSPVIGKSASFVSARGLLSDHCTLEGVEDGI